MSTHGTRKAEVPPQAGDLSAGNGLFMRLDGSNVAPALFKNALINSAFDIWQRGGTAASGFVADRWTTYNGGNGTVTTEQFTVAPGENTGSGSTFALRLKQTGRTTGQAQLIQSIEGVRTFAGRRVILTGWVRSAAAVPSLSVTLDQNFGSGGSSFVSTSLGAIAVSAVWTKFTTSAANLPSILGKTLGTNNALYLNVYLPATDLQIDFMDLELKEVIPGYGDQVPPFERIPGDIDLLRCQRYFFRAYDPPLRGIVTQTQRVSRMGMSLPVRMRAAWSLALGGSLGIFDGSTTAQVTAIALNFVNMSRDRAEVDLEVSNALTVGRPAVAFVSGAGYIDFNAEL